MKVNVSMQMQKTEHGTVYRQHITCPVCGTAYTYEEQRGISKCRSCGADLEPLYTEEEEIRYICGGD